MTILDKIVNCKQEEIQQAKKQTPLEKLKDTPFFHQPTRGFIECLKSNPYGIIAEFKRKSPSKNNINIESKIQDVLPLYKEYGAACVSVLTDTPFFGGSLTDLEEANAYDIPLLRKDFIVDDYQIYQAKAHGADCILLIANILAKSQIEDLTDTAHHLGLDVLLEFYSGEDFDKYYSKLKMVGINNRNLNTFEVDYEHAIRMRNQLPEGTLGVAESAIYSSEIYKKLKHNGFDAFLMGEYFMKQDHIGAALQSFIEEIK
ncbi:indole-3-glycerol phosphate synthase TrpC [Riemerella anatipestifer]|uniref:indole-3-glycerol phosphate synthase TrpC n=1 Tax=Riemerella anatipestifer TaxID=34085 RepID=UPI00129ECDE5|nr:indole-3-glycerol phosphate synthase TrpC [Riemerella anatipestifer]MDR7694298.1 indole-3-glycerol phosphate synthase TrpC [Riemerella anatipestifer]MDR7795045.1 indole-3-glycerol phosphate synthase TrpC [Riemerella anatipestifer]MDY3450641.1 indole-3-glycerol phosphate synthase TrpC [Riemerella anatipestifer]MRN16141.1 indole-3-glycerol phosphate synthase TrpC [Riemerella anatipestifer]